MKAGTRVEQSLLIRNRIEMNHLESIGEEYKGLGQMEVTDLVDLACSDKFVLLVKYRLVWKCQHP